MVIGSFADICVSDVAESVSFYRSLLELEIVVDHGWYAELGVGGTTLLAIVQSGHETVPACVQLPAGGVLVSFEVDDVETIASTAASLGVPIVKELVTELGQRHLMVSDPDGFVVDVIERVRLTPSDLRLLAQYRRQHAVRSSTCP
jgi:catechol 2,3-dioxygenase-like lactoylglutathione lyase family enzyme